MRKHEHLLPKMSDGYRINGDRNIYFGNPDDYKLIRLIRERTRREDASEKDDLILAYFIHCLDKTKFSNKAKAWVLSAIGMTQEEIAKKIGCDRSRISRYLCA